MNTCEEELGAQLKGRKERDVSESGRKADAPFACIMTVFKLVRLKLADELPTLQMCFIIPAIPIEAEDVRPARYYRCPIIASCSHSTAL